jgi:predicted SAM-dependent methyltransferase
MKVILGAGKTAYSGWVSTQQEELDMLRREDFVRVCGGEEKLDALLAEHVWEHMTLEEGGEAARNCFAFLKPGGYIRCAVPDANFRNEWYQNMVQAGGPGPVDHPAYSHKIVYDYRTFKSVFEEAGFLVELLEYCDEAGDFHYCHWHEDDGKIGRSFRFDTRNSLEKLGMVSIILDAKKPLIIHSGQ